MTVLLPARFAGSISEATLHPRHLIPRFVVVLEQANPGHPLVIEWRQVDGAVRTLAEFMSVDGEAIADFLGLWESEHTGYLLEALFDALNEVAPEGTYFSASEGDGASFGFWSLDECEECGVAGGNPACWNCTPNPQPEG